VLEVLGNGGFGTVVKAFDKKLHRFVAIKLMSPFLATTSVARKRFVREARSAAAVRHENVIAIYGVEDQPIPYLVMEYVAGRTLQQKVDATGPLELMDVLRIGQQIAGGLAAAHAMGLIHRDIKPSNIIACERGGLHDVAKLLDFGLVRSHGLGTGADNLTQEGALAGTPAYMSPEQADGKKDLDARSDIYSLGAVAYYLLTGQPPFVRPTQLQTLIAHACDAPIPPDQLQAEVPPDLRSVVLRCLEKDPAQRFPDARNLDRALAACQAAGLWTEELAVAWWHGQSGRADGANSVADATTSGA
jgi:eukaryotic-like serine/threonine-protein kinase